MRVYLMQHGQALSAEQDAAKPLSPAGVDTVKAAARGMRHLGLHFDLIATSTKRRATQSAALIAEGVRYPHSDILASEALLPDRDAQEALDLLRQEAADSAILIVGHLPQLDALARQLMPGLNLAFANAGLSAFELDQNGSTQLLFSLPPQQLARC
jgi:phosphohistidine phosphatase